VQINFVLAPCGSANDDHTEWLIDILGILMDQFSLCNFCLKIKAWALICSNEYPVVKSAINNNSVL
jgi:hypothetical protein